MAKKTKIWKIMTQSICYPKNGFSIWFIYDEIMFNSKVDRFSFMWINASKIAKIF